MNNKLLFFSVSLFFSAIIQAQISDWRSSTLFEDSNYFSIVQQNRTALQKLKARGDRNSRKQVKQFERWANFWKDRILPDGKFVSAAHTYNEWVKENQRHAQLRNTSNNAVWTLVGPSTLPKSDVTFYPGMGRVNTIAFNGTDTNTMYAATPGGGIWKTTNGGTTWVAKGDKFPNLGVSDIVINPSNTNILYLASGDWDGRHNRSLGVLKSTNGGDTWNTTGLTFTLGQNDIISKLLIDPNNTNTIFATTKNSIKRSTDGGATWTDVHADNNALFNDIAYKIGSSTVMYATSNRGRFYISTNNGSSWSVASTPSTERIDFALTAHNPNLILSLDSRGVVRRSTNQGSTWTTVSTINRFGSQGGYNMSIAISPIDANLVIVGGVEGWRSKNGGSTWENYLVGYWEQGQPFFYVHSDHHDMKFIPGTNIAFSANDGGIFRGDASKDTKWQDLSEGLAITQYYNVSGTPQNANFLIVGAQDNDVTQYDGTNWNGRNPGSDGVEGLWDYSNSNIAWTCSQAGGMERTLNGFASSERVNTPQGAPFVWELEIHPTNPQTIFGGFADIYRSTNRGDNWTNLNSGAGTIEFISIAPSNPDVIYVSGENGVRKTTNGGTSWTTINLPQGGNVKSIEVHPTNPDEVYIAYSGYVAIGKVYRSTNGGTNWTNISGSLPNIPIHKIIYRTGSSNGELFLATDLGVYYRTNTLGNWVRLGTGLPNVIAHDIEIHYGTEKLRVATYGRGIWEVSISAAALGVPSHSLPKDAVSLYPNPTKNNEVTVKLHNLTGESRVMVYNLIGSVVQDFVMSNIQEKINLNGFAKGLYFVKVTNQGNSLTQKLIVK